MMKKYLAWSALLATAMMAACDNGGDTGETGDVACTVDADGDSHFDVDDPCGTGDDYCDDNADSFDEDDCNDPCPEAGNTIETACDFTTALGEWRYDDDAIQSAGDRDFWKFNTLAGNWYIVWAERRGVDPGAPDTVLRVYDSNKTEIAENDDMPYRMKDTDAAHLFQAVNDETIYIETLEWSDWAEDGAIGDPSYVYRMGVFEGEIVEVNPDNDTFADAVNFDGGQWYSFPFKDPWPYWAPGVIETPGDVDVYPIDFLSEDSLCQFGTWPDSPTLLNAKLNVYWEDCIPRSDTDDGDCDGEGAVLIASTTDAETRPVGTFFSEDAGVTAYIPSGAYYAEIEDADGMGGNGYFYNLMSSCYLTDFFEKEFEDGNNSPVSNTPVTMDESSTVAGRFFGTFHGSRQALTSGTDDMDTFKVSSSLGNGRYMTVNLEAENVGSIVGDIKMTFWYEAAGEYIEMTSVTGRDPQIRDYQLSNKETAVYVTLEYPGSYSGPASQYFGTIITSDTPVYP
jgi:hypothetical protein